MRWNGSTSSRSFSTKAAGWNRQPEGWEFPAARFTTNLSSTSLVGSLLELCSKQADRRRSDSWLSLALRRRLSSIFNRISAVYLQVIPFHAFALYCSQTGVLA